VVLVLGIVLVLSVWQNSAFALEGTQKAEIKNARLLNSFGDIMSQNINTSQQIQISADVLNQQATKQEFVYIVQILDGNGIEQKITWFSASLGPQQSLSPALSWTPTVPGTYTAEIYVWDSIRDANALAKPVILKILVS
jgi:hypothetical protein